MWAACVTYKKQSNSYCNGKRASTGTDARSSRVLQYGKMFQTKPTVLALRDTGYVLLRFGSVYSL